MSFYSTLICFLFYSSARGEFLRNYIQENIAENNLSGKVYTEPLANDSAYAAIKRSDIKTEEIWAPKVTIPEPFSMTIRDEAGRFKATYSAKFVSDMLQASQEEDIRRESTKFKAKPVPASTYLPLYEELLNKTESRRQFLREYCREILKNQQKPFNLRFGIIFIAFLINT